MAELHVFQVTNSDWWAAEHADDAVKGYREMVGDDVADEDIADFGLPEMMNDEQLDRMKIVEIDEPGHPTHTFRQALKEVEDSGVWPAFIATTEY